MTNEQAVFLLGNYLTGLGHAALPDAGHGYRPGPVTRTAREIAWRIALSKGWFRRSLLSGEFGMFQNAAVTYLGFLIRHSVHHRGQLAAILRGAGGKAPNLYGGSADEPMM